MKKVKNYDDISKYREYWKKGRELNLFPKVDYPKWMVKK